MIDQQQLWLPDAHKTKLSGESLASSLYRFPVDIYLTGELGAGKTTFLQGFAKALGVTDALTSPTYALEQHYQASLGQPFVHIDLYRLTPKRAAELIHTTNDHAGIRCIEWADRLEPIDRNTQRIDLAFSEEREGRSLNISFSDIATPPAEQIDTWRKDVALPPHIIAHCDSVADLSGTLADHLMQRGMIVRKTALIHAAKLHDLFRFVDFRPSAAPENVQISPETETIWERWKQHYPNMRHEAVVTSFLQQKNYPDIAEIVRVHGLQLPSPERTTIEQKILFYADKRMALDTLVSLDERFADFRKRYTDGKSTEEAAIWYEEAKRMEQELFPEGVPC